MIAIYIVSIDIVAIAIIVIETIESICVRIKWGISIIVITAIIISITIIYIVVWQII